MVSSWGGGGGNVVLRYVLELPTEKKSNRLWMLESLGGQTVNRRKKNFVTEYTLYREYRWLWISPMVHNINKYIRKTSIFSFSTFSGTHSYFSLANLAPYDRTAVKNTDFFQLFLMVLKTPNTLAMLSVRPEY